MAEDQTAPAREKWDRLLHDVWSDAAMGNPYVKSKYMELSNFGDEMARFVDGCAILGATEVEVLRRRVEDLKELALLSRTLANAKAALDTARQTLSVDPPVRVQVEAVLKQIAELPPRPNR